MLFPEEVTRKFFNFVFFFLPVFPLAVKYYVGCNCCSLRPILSRVFLCMTSTHPGDLWDREDSVSWALGTWSFSLSPQLDDLLCHCFFLWIEAIVPNMSAQKTLPPTVEMQVLPGRREHMWFLFLFGLRYEYISKTIGPQEHCTFQEKCTSFDFILLFFIFYWLLKINSNVMEIFKQFNRK